MMAEKTPLYHTVKADQTIYAISREYNVPVNRLLKAEPTLKNSKVVTGQKSNLKKIKESYGNQSSFSTAG